MADAWDRWKEKGAGGVIWMDPDLVADPDDLAAMHAQITLRPDSVWVARHKLWPASTGRDTWVWGWGRWASNRPEMSQDPFVTPEWFALGMTYTPGELLEVVWYDLPVWVYGTIDMGLSRTARELQLPMGVVHQARPKHVHFLPRPGDWGYGA